MQFGTGQANSSTFFELIAQMCIGLGDYVNATSDVSNVPALGDALGDEEDDEDEGEDEGWLAKRMRKNECSTRCSEANLNLNSERR